MAFKRALVVDDSRTARQSLARLLAQHDLEVAFAESGEAALAFLKEELVDVIFMDHTMPGMDGLEAVSAIKSNPRTATIPVMMYTTKEGEVYVSQARALGAVGVLPKQFHPNELFHMLEKLGLVTDRRNQDAEPDPATTPRRRITDLADEVDAEYDRRALGVSVQTLVTRILEEQHLKLRAEILSGQRQFARQVAAEILERHGATEGDPAPDPESSPRRTTGAWPSAVTGTLAVVSLVLGIVLWQVVQERNAARLEIARMNTASHNEMALLTRRNAGLDADLREHAAAAGERYREAVAALEWSLNESPLVPFDRQPFDDAAAVSLVALLELLAGIGYRGTVTVTASLASFCLTRDEAAEWRLADPELPLEDCELLGHPLRDVASLGALQSVAFASALTDAASSRDIRVRLAAREADGDGTAPSGDADRAGVWNRLAAERHRLIYSLTPPPLELASQR